MKIGKLLAALPLAIGVTAPAAATITTLTVNLNNPLYVTPYTGPLSVVGVDLDIKVRTVFQVYAYAPTVTLQGYIGWTKTGGAGTLSSGDVTSPFSGTFDCTAFTNCSIYQEHSFSNHYSLASDLATFAGGITIGGANFAETQNSSGNVNRPATSFSPISRVTYYLDDGVGAVPEPASWVMMIGGFGLIGGAIRRQRRLGAIVHQ